MFFFFIQIGLLEIDKIIQGKLVNLNDMPEHNSHSD